MKPHWNITNRRTDNVAFTRMLRPAPCNESEDVGTFPYEILTIELGSFVRSGFVSGEFKTRTVNVVEVSGRFFEVGFSESGGGTDKRTWLSVSLPPELDPTPPPREWDVFVSEAGNLLLADGNNGNVHNKPVFKVREVRP